MRLVLAKCYQLYKNTKYERGILWIIKNDMINGIYMET